MGVYGITDWLRLQGTSGGHFVQPPCSSRLFRAVASWVLHISTDGDSTTSLGKLFQCSTTLPGKKCFLVFLQIISCVSTGKILSSSSSFPTIRYLFTFIRSPLSLLFFRLVIPSSSSLFSREVLQSLNHRFGPA